MNANCRKCGANFVKTQQRKVFESDHEGLCLYCERDALFNIAEHYRKSNETQGRIRGEQQERIALLESVLRALLAAERELDAAGDVESFDHNYIAQNQAIECAEAKWIAAIVAAKKAIGA